MVDTNILWADVGAQRPMLRTVLDGAASGDYEVAVPQVVVDELRNQYPERLKNIELAMGTAIGKLAPEFARLNLDPPALPTYDTAAMSVAYEQLLGERLRGRGVRVVPHPDDLTPILAWGVAKRSPFKKDGQGVPDAVIWLTVLEIARSGRDVLLLTENVKDFGAPEDSKVLGPALVTDLQRAGVPVDRVRLVAGARAFVEERLPALAAPDRRATLLTTEPSRRSRLISALEQAVYFRPLPNTDLELELELADGPQASALDIEAVAVTRARQLDDGRLLLDLDVIADAALLVYVAHSDIDILPDGFEVTNYEWNERFAEAETESVLGISTSVVTDPQATTVEVDLLDATMLEPDEVVNKRLERLEDRLFERLDELASAAAGTLNVSHFSPAQPLEGVVDSARAAHLNFEDVTVGEVENLGSFGFSVLLTARARADVTWTVTHPTPLDIRHNVDAVEGSSGQELLNGLAVSQPVLVRASAISTASDWEQTTISEVLMDADRPQL